MRYVDNRLVFSPSDLLVWLNGDFASWMDRYSLESRRASVGGGGNEWQLFQPDEDDPEKALFAERGIEHERATVDLLRARYGDLVEIDRDRDPASAASTIRALCDGVPVIYQGCLQLGRFQGYPDFLVRVPNPDSSPVGTRRSGDSTPLYEVWDTKLARSMKPYFILQLCAYAEMLEPVQGRRPEEMVVLSGLGLEQRLRVNDFFDYYLTYRDAYLAFQDRFDPTGRPDPGLERERDHGRWSGLAESILAAADHPGQVAGIRRRQIARLRDAGITTMTALATSHGAVARLRSDLLARLRDQARLQIESRELERPRYRVLPADEEDPRRGLALLPPASPGDVFFDMEGFPLIDRNLEYLFGAAYFDLPDESRGPEFRSWWAHDDVAEKTAFEGFIDWVTERRGLYPDLHIYHYASYEENALKNLSCRHGTREEAVDDLLRGDVLVDLLRVVRQGVRVGTPSYSLKEIERLYLAPRTGEVKSAGGSVVAYHSWVSLPAGERDDGILDSIRDYNRIDCESTWGLAEWLRRVQAEGGIGYLPPAIVEPRKESSIEAAKRDEALARRLEILAESESDSERSRVASLLSYLVGFYRREDKPVWWQLFERREATEEDLARDIDCLTGLEKSDRALVPEKKSLLWQYRYDPDIDTKLHAGDKVEVHRRPELRILEIFSMDPEQGLLELKAGKGKELPDRLSIIPNDHVSSDKMQEAVCRFAERWLEQDVRSPALEDLLFRRSPRIDGHPGGALLGPGQETVEHIIGLAERLDDSTLCIQGPPGTGKTYTAARMIRALLQRGCRVGVAANSHAAILNLLKATHEAPVEVGGVDRARIVKIAGDTEHELIVNGTIEYVEKNEGIAAALVGAPVVIGATVHAFCRPEMEGTLDYLIVDEAGQVSLANVIAMGASARNLILVGDQMQLAQPVKGAHPGESGKSALGYYLQQHQTIPPDLGLLLDVTYRMHPEICRFISDAVYEGRLTADRITAERWLEPLMAAGSSLPSASAMSRAPPVVARGEASSVTVRGEAPKQSPFGEFAVNVDAGLVFIAVEHQDNAQCSSEEVDAIGAIVQELRGRRLHCENGTSRPLTLDDILFVAPYNMQVRRLKARLGASAKVGSVDKFQGQEAPVVIVSMCTSSLDDVPRGAEFLLSPNRINVAISRAQCLAIVVGSPAIATARCTSVKQMRLVNLYCKIVREGIGRAGPM